jgi:hypothetical protein
MGEWAFVFYTLHFTLYRLRFMVNALRSTPYALRQKELDTVTMFNTPYASRLAPYTSRFMLYGYLKKRIERIQQGPLIWNDAEGGYGLCC